MNTKAKAKKKVKKTVKAKNKQYLVTYLVGSIDPVEVFNSVEEAKAFVNAVFTRNQEQAESLASENSGLLEGDYEVDEIDLESIRLYEGVLIGKPKVTVVFE